MKWLWVVGLVAVFLAGCAGHVVQDGQIREVREAVQGKADNEIMAEINEALVRDIMELKRDIFVLDKKMEKVLEELKTEKVIWLNSGPYLITPIKK